MDQQDIDSLLERYLGLLDEYTRLRQDLSRLQSSVYQNIARANFSGERGMRYGQDHYDDRMQASRVVTITNGDASVPVFAITKATEEEGLRSPQKPRDGDKGEDFEAEEVEETKQPKQRDPLRWFGLLAPMPLRAAQSDAVQAVEQVIPKLLSVNAEMQAVEIEVRRARKKRAKAESARTKEKRSKEESTAGTTAQEAPIEAA